ncbi:MAG: alpha/beta fold hydrolase, partial [Actinomadura sp.]
MSTPRFLTLPPGVRRMDIDGSRGTFAALEALPGSGVPERNPALLVPGFTGSKEDFIAVLHTLAQAGRRRVVAVDMRGQYETPGPDDPAAYTCSALAADVAALIEALGPERVHLVGHSFGGLVAREAVIDDPARFASVTLMSSGPAAITGRSADNARSLSTALPELGIERIWSLKMGPDALARGLSAEVVAFLRDRMLKNSMPGMIGMAQELLSCA